MPRARAAAGVTEETSRSRMRADRRQSLARYKQEPVRGRGEHARAHLARVHTA